MKKISFIALILITPILPQDSAEVGLDIQDHWFGSDKVQHVAFSFLWVLSTQYIAVNKFNLDEKDAFPISFVSGASIGLLKEIYDERISNEHFSKKDLIADGLGLFLASAVIFTHLKE